MDERFSKRKAKKNAAVIRAKKMREAKLKRKKVQVEGQAKNPSERMRLRSDTRAAEAENVEVPVREEPERIDLCDNCKRAHVDLTKIQYQNIHYDRKWCFAGERSDRIRSSTGQRHSSDDLVHESDRDRTHQSEADHATGSKYRDRCSGSGHPRTGRYGTRSRSAGRYLWICRRAQTGDQEFRISRRDR